MLRHSGHQDSDHDDDGDEVEAEEEEEGSDDSLYDILTGRTPIPDMRHSIDVDAIHSDGDDLGDSIGTLQGLDDTFRGKRAEREREAELHDEYTFHEHEEGVLGDSGMSEMF